MPEISILLFIIAGLIFVHQLTKPTKNLKLILIGYIILTAAYFVLHH
jgi:hypothetical protein